MVDLGINLDALQSGLKSVRSLRSTTLEVFKFLGDGAPVAYGDEEREKFVNEVQGILNNVRNRMRDLETACTLLGSPNAPLSLGTAGLLSQDPAYEKTPLYSELIKAHRWFDKVLEVGSQANSIFAQNSLKRGYYSLFTPLKQARTRLSGHNLLPQNVDNSTNNVARMFPDLQLKVMKPYGSSSIIVATVSRTLKSLFLLRGLIIDWVLIKGYDEDFYTEDNKLDMWSPSRYLVFQKITEHANASMLHFYSPNLPELAVRSFLTWLRSYQTLFTHPCRKCGNRLHNNMPPTWRDVRNLDIYHESCKP